MKDYPHILGRVFNTPLALHPDKLATVLSVLGPRLGLNRDQVTEAAARAGGEGNVLPEKLAAVPGAVKTDKPYALTEGGVAVIPILGTLVHRAAVAAPPSMLWSYGEIETMFLDAVTDPAVKAVMLDINSGGGEVSGVFDLARQIHSARGLKPIWAAADEFAFSAAYAIASAADRVTVAATGAVGSVGVIAVHRDESARDREAGLKYTAVYAGARKNDFTPHARLSDEARQRLQESVDETYDLFAATVARHRSMSVEAVKATEAATFAGHGGGAVGSGLADAVMPFREALAELSEAADRPVQTYFPGAGSAASQPGKQEETRMSDNANKDAPDMGAKSAETKTPAENTQSKNETPAAQTGADNVVDLDAARKEGHEQGHAAAGEIAQLCDIAGRADLTAGYLEKKTSVADVRADLLRRRAEGNDAAQT